MEAHLMSSLNKQAYCIFQMENPEVEKFNDDLIFWRNNDDIQDYLKDVFSAMEIIPEIKLNNIKIIKDESQFPKEIIRNEIEDSRLDLAQINFTVTAEGESETLTLNLFLPKLINNFFYRLKGNLYYPILQLVDRGTYSTKKTFTLKTLLMPIIFRIDKREVFNNYFNNEEYIQGMEFILDLFKSRINVLEYFYCQFGLEKTIEFFGFNSDDFTFINEADLSDEYSSEYFFKKLNGKTTLMIGVKKTWFNDNDQSFKESFFVTLCNSLDGVNMKQLEKELEENQNELWMKRLGKKFSPNSNNIIGKAEKILTSLCRILDERTKKNLKHVKNEDKLDIFHILRWMMLNYRVLSRLDPMDLNNKRIRVTEYLIHKLLLRLSDGTYRILNSRKVTLRRITGIFNSIKPFFIINKIINNELIRYGNAVNQHDLFSVALKYTMRGPQALGGKKSMDISIRNRGIHPSYIGRFGLNSASASDPGMSGTLVPFAKTEDTIFKQEDYELEINNDLKFLITQEEEL
jgi:hypothetical protein